MGQAVEERKFEETLGELTVLIGAFNVMNKMLLGFQKNGWVLSAMEVRRLIKIWCYIYRAGTKVLKNPLGCDIWADDVKSYGNLYAYGTLGQSTNNVGSSHEPCRLKRAIEKLCTIHFQIGILIRFAYSPRMRFMLTERKLRITPAGGT